MEISAQKNKRRQMKKMKLEKYVGIWLICSAVFQFILALSELNTLFYGVMSAIYMILGIALLRSGKDEIQE